MSRIKFPVQIMFPLLLLMHWPFTGGDSFDMGSLLMSFSLNLQIISMGSFSCLSLLNIAATPTQNFSLPLPLPLQPTSIGVFY